MSIFNRIINKNMTDSIGVFGMTNEFFCIYISNIYNKQNKDILILTSTLYEANQIYRTMESYNENVLLFPMDDFLTSEAISISPELKMTRLYTLNRLCVKKPHVLITHLDAFLRFLPEKKVYMANIIYLKKNIVYSREKLINNLYRNGYIKETNVTNTGEMGVRGYIIDVFPVEEELPIRIEFFGDEIDSIRTFDVETQKSLSEIDNVSIKPNTEFLTNNINYEVLDNQKFLSEYAERIVNISSYMSNPLIIVKDINQIKCAYEKLSNDIFEYALKDMQYKGQYLHKLEPLINNVSMYYNTIDNTIGNNKIESCNFGVSKIENFEENIEKINFYIEKKLKQGKTIIIALKDFQIRAFIKYFNNKYILTDENNILANKVNIINVIMHEGFEYENYIFLTANELFKNKINNLKYKTKYKYSSKIKNIESINIGDYVVHSVNGIGIYNGIKTLTKGNLKKDYLEIQYFGNDKLYIPVEKIELISKYTGKEGIQPKIHKLGSTDWINTKSRVRAKVENVAKKLIELYAERSLKKGIQFAKDDEMQIMFENEFPYQETPDQLSAIKEIKKDMESAQPMDRLLCGDVGYGKTEVAFRAMFKATCNSKQVLYLCPTTILSKQQYENAKERFKNYPINIEIMNRFTTNREVKRIVNDVANGTVDILFGTHRILSNDIKPKNLGLLVIDEEQRFGVMHKEKIKEYKCNIDVLTLTATPIPRTLQMSLVGIRNLSLIETPPIDRYPVQTYVIEENKQLIKDAIYKEMSRNGQVYILYNRVQDIEQKVKQIENLVPEARIVCAHGQLNKTELENKMLNFINYKYDILVCTTIIETGIDIPNVNTLIILNADKFGLSQLYQIRGRVGRSNQIAYSYLMYTKDKVLTEMAIKRLDAIKEFTELGSGFSIASRDLSIRGAGDILGNEQAGFIDSVGINLYLRILNEEIRRLNGESVSEETKINFTNLIEVETHIDDNYVDDNDLKIEIHQIINEVDSYNKLNEVKSILEDRFGKLNNEMLIYMYEEWFESMARKLNITKVIQNKNSIEIYLNNDITEKVNCDQLFCQAFSITPNFNFKYKNKNLIITLSTDSLENHYIYYLTELLSYIEKYI